MIGTTDNPFAARRRELALTIREVAIRVGLSENTIWRWEHDVAVPRLSHAGCICATYQVDQTTFVGWIGTLAARVISKRGVA